MDLLNYIVENALVLIPALWVIGAIIKKIPNAPDWIIPFVLLGLAVAGAIGLLGFSVDSIIQGVLVAGAAVFGNQIIKQGNEAIHENKNIGS